MRNRTGHYSVWCIEGKLEEGRRKKNVKRSLPAVQKENRITVRLREMNERV